MDYDALTIDTQTVETNGFHFDGGLLGQLKQFADGRVEVIISAVVAAEIARHLRGKTQGAKDALESAHKKAQLYGLKAAGEAAFLEPPDAHALSRKRLMQYFHDIGATIIPPDDVPMGDLVRTYVQAAPPFAGTGKKKSEFPDAIALLSLEQWAKKHDKRVLAVSGDADWGAFAAKSDHIDVVKDLSEALEKLQEDVEEAEAIVEQLLSDIATGANPAMADRFERLLADQVSSANAYPEADSAYAFEGDDLEVSLDRYELDNVGGEFMPRITQVGRAIIVASISLRVFVTATANFSLSAWDSIDKEYVGIGSTTARKEDEEVEVTVLVTFEGNFAAGEVELTKVELTEGLSSIHFGEVEPDYGEPDYQDFAENETPEVNANTEATDDTPF